jgi:hypothetical protein
MWLNRDSEKAQGHSMAFTWNFDGLELDGEFDENFLRSDAMISSLVVRGRRTHDARPWPAEADDQGKFGLANQARPSGAEPRFSWQHGQAECDQPKR